MSWLPKYFRTGLRAIASLGNLMPFRSTANFTGTGVTITDDPTNDQTTINIQGGGNGTFNPTLDATSATVTPGDSTVSASLANTHVTRAKGSSQLTAPGAQGVVTVGAPPGGQPTVAVAGLVDTTITGLGEGAAVRAAVDPVSGRLMRVRMPKGGETFIGNADAKGKVTVAPIQHVGTTPHFKVNATAAPYGAIPDAQFFYIPPPAGVTPGLTNHLTGFPADTFVAGVDEGKLFVLASGNFGHTPSDLHTTIVSVDPGGTGVVLANALLYGGVLNTFLCYWGTDNTDAIQSMLDAAQALGHRGLLPTGGYMFNGTLHWRDGVACDGDGAGSGTQFGSGTVLIYAGTGTAVEFESVGGVWGDGKPMDAPLNGIRLTTCTSDSQVGVHITDAFGVDWHNLIVYGLLTFGVNPGFSGFADAGIKLESSEFGNAFQVFVGCKAAFCAGDGLQLTANAFSVTWIGGGFSECGGYGIHSLNPGGGATTNIYVIGADFESCILGGFGGYGDTVSIQNSYIEQGGVLGQGGPLVVVQAPSYS